MLSIEQLRRIDPDLTDLTDEELLNICDQCYALGQLIFDSWLEARQENGSKYHVGALQETNNSPKIKLWPPKK